MLWCWPWAMHRPRATSVPRCRPLFRSTVHSPRGRRNRRPSRQAQRGGHVRRADPERSRQRFGRAYRCSRQRCRETPRWRSNRRENRWFQCWTPRGPLGRRSSGPLRPWPAQRRGLWWWEGWSVGGLEWSRCRRTRAPSQRRQRSTSSLQIRDLRPRPSLR